MLHHVLAARSLLTTDVAGTTKFRQQALDLITATQDLRAAASVILRRNTKVQFFERVWIDIPLGQQPSIKITDKDDGKRSTHAEIEFTARHQMLKTALQQVINRHPVLHTLPETCTLRLSGIPTYLDLSIKDMTKPESSLNHVLNSALFEYSNLSILAEILSEIHYPPTTENADWHLELEGRGRSMASWRLNGTTLAQAIAKAIDPTEDRASMTLVDLMIDLLADDYGAANSIKLYRILDSR